VQRQNICRGNATGICEENPWNISNDRNETVLLPIVSNTWPTDEKGEQKLRAEEAERSRAAEEAEKKRATEEALMLSTAAQDSLAAAQRGDLVLLSDGFDVKARGETPGGLQAVGPASLSNSAPVRRRKGVSASYYSGDNDVQELVSLIPRTKPWALYTAGDWDAKQLRLKD
jgi:hypothetical protein